MTPADSDIGQGDIDAADTGVVAAQLGRTPRSIHAVAHRCPCGNPDVVATEPRLEDGTPFPTTFYLTCPRANSRIGTLEASGLMREMTERLAEDEQLAAAYGRAHEDYLAARSAIGEVPEIAGVSAGGMPDRVKCLHVLAAHSLARGRGVNPLGDEVLDQLGEWWRSGPCVSPSVVEEGEERARLETTGSGGFEPFETVAAQPPQEPTHGVARSSTTQGREEREDG